MAALMAGVVVAAAMAAAERRWVLHVRKNPANLQGCLCKFRLCL